MAMIELPWSFFFFARLCFQFPLMEIYPPQQPLVDIETISAALLPSENPLCVHRNNFELLPHWLTRRQIKAAKHGAASLSKP